MPSTRLSSPPTRHHKPSAAEIWVTENPQLYPFESHWLSLGQHRYHYLDEGPRHAPAIVMLHGNPTWSFYYRELVIALRQHYRVIVPDHLGCGLSDKPQHYPYTLAQHIENLTALLDNLRLTNITLVVHDWGGAIGMGYATQNPENIAGTVVFNTAAFFVPRIPKRIAMCRIPYLGEVLVRGLNGFSLAALAFASSQWRRWGGGVAGGYLAPYNSWANRVAVHRFVNDIPMEEDHPSRSALREIELGLKRLRGKPMLILWGDDDFCFTTADFLPRWQERFPKAEVQIIKKAGHYVVQDAPETVIPAMRNFLQTLHPSPKQKD